MSVTPSQVKWMHDEINRLRAELEETKRAAADAQDVSKFWTEQGRKLHADNTRLRAENAKLLAALKYADRYRSVWPLGLRNAVDTILATHAEGPSAAPER